VSALRFSILLCSLAVLLPSAPVAREFSGSSTTIFRLFDLHLPESEDVRPWRPVDQLLTLSWARLGREEAWSIDTTLRGRVDLATDHDGAQEDFQVLHAEASWRSSKGRYGLILGRQRTLTGLGWSAFDGARFDFRPRRRGRLFAFAGLPVPIGENSWPDGDGLIFGGGASYSWPEHGSVALDYESRNEDGIVVSEVLGSDLQLDVGRVSLTANADYSLGQGRFGETNAIAEVRLGRRHFVEASFRRTQPLFRADSILSVFLANASTEKRAGYEYRGDGRFRIGAFFARENFEDTAVEELQDPERPVRPEDLERFALTATLGGPRESEYLLELAWQEGWAGERLGGRFDASWDWVRGLRGGAGLSVHRYENLHGLTEADEQYSLRARLSHDHRGRWDLGGMIEHFWGRDRDSLRGSLVFRVKLGAARRQRPWWGGRDGWAWATGTRRPLADESPDEEVSAD